MNKIIYSLPFLAILCSSVNTIAMKQKKTPLLVIPDSKSTLQHGAFDIFSEEQYHIVRIVPPFADIFAPKRKQNYENLIEKKINESSEKVFIYALGDGVSFAFNYAAKHSNKIAGILAEATRLTKNHYIFDLCTKISPNIPIMFIHDSNKHTLPSTNNIALYYQLLKTNPSRITSTTKTLCLTILQAIKSTNDLEEKINTDSISNIHDFLRNNFFYYEDEKIKSTVNTDLLLLYSSKPSISHRNHLKGLIEKENRRYRKKKIIDMVKKIVDIVGKIVDIINILYSYLLLPI